MRSGLAPDVAGLLQLQRSAGNNAVSELISGSILQRTFGDHSGNLMIQRKTVTQLNVTAELSSNDDFRSLVAKVAKGGPAQTLKLAEAFTEASKDSSEDPAKLVTAMEIAWMPVLNAIRVKKTAAARTAETAWRTAKADVTRMARERQEEILTKQRDEAAAKELAEKNEEDANTYWNSIQSSGVGTASFGAPLEFLRVQGFVKLQKPHRCFLSSWEKDNNGVRDDGKFGISSELTPSPKIKTPGPQLVLHMHCRKDGKVLSAGIKYKSMEKQGGANVVLESLAFLTLDFGLTGDNVETEIGAFN